MINNLLKIQSMLEEYFTAFNEKFFEGKLPEVVITIQSSGKKKNVLGWFSEDKLWRDDKNEYHEINVCAEQLNRGTIELLTTLLHEMVHLGNFVNGIKDVSKSGNHNKKFKELAESVWLEVYRDDKLGYAVTNPTVDLERFIKSLPLYEEFTLHRIEIKPEEKPKPISFKHICPSCGVNFRTRKEGNFKCLDCDSELEMEEC